MSIKNWTVTTERVKGKSAGTIEYANYLVSKKHKNHKNTEIVHLWSLTIEDFLKKTIENTTAFDANNKKGGRKVESYAQSFNFILPPPHKPTKEQWTNIAADLIKVIHKNMSIQDTQKEFASHLFANIHDQANPHLNLLIPRIYKDKRLEDLDRKRLLIDLKSQFNISVLKHCNINFEHHNPIKQNVGPRRRKWQNEQDNAQFATANATQRIAEAEAATEKSNLAAKATRQERILIEIENKKSMGLLDHITKETEKLSFFMSLYQGFKDKLLVWCNSVRKDSYLDELIARSDVSEKADEMIKHPLCDDNDVDLIDAMIDSQVEELKADGYNPTTPEIDKTQRRKYRP